MCLFLGWVSRAIGCHSTSFPSKIRHACVVYRNDPSKSSGGIRRTITPMNMSSGALTINASDVEEANHIPYTHHRLHMPTSLRVLYCSLPFSDLESCLTVC
jgi:hypothetical protein